ncbi:MAG: gliding motility-associated C-terminal domain-containing protein [Bacteroidia bacterium]
MAFLKKHFYPTLSTGFLLLSASVLIGQNSMIGDGFGGRRWYKPTNYTVGSYSAFSLCYGNPCDSSTNQLFGWGHDAYGELGNATGGVGSATPVAIPNMTNVRYYSTGYNMGAIKNNGTGWVWGMGLYASPTQVITNAKFLDGSIDFISFVKNDGTVWSVGNNSYGNFGDGTISSFSLMPVQMSNIGSAVRVADGEITTCVLLSNGKVMSVGDDGSTGMLGSGNGISSRTIADTIPGLSNIIDIKSHSVATAALDSSGDVYVWGAGGYIGDGSMNPAFTPTKLTGLSNIIAISGCADGFHFLALDENKNCFGWGADYYGQFGSGGASPSGFILSPILVATNVIDIMAGETFSYIVKADGTLWGSGGSNGASIWLNLQDSLRSTFTMLSPQLVPGSCSIVGTSVSTSNACNGSTGTITVNQFGGSSPYQYSIGSGYQSSNVFTALTPGSYTIQVSDANQCVMTSTCQIDSAIGAVPVVSVNSETICPGTSAVLNASGAGSYTWSNTSGLNTNTGSTVTATPLTTTVYTVTGTNANNCSGVATSTVTVSQLPTVSQSKDSICAGENVLLSASGATIYQWTPATSLSTANGSSVVAAPNVTTNYNLQTTNGSCVYNQSVTVYVYPSPVANFSGLPQAAVPIGTSLDLLNTSLNTSSVHWQTCDGISSGNNLLNVIFNTPESCCISLIADDNGCADTVTKCIEVYEPFSISIPNVFSPNGDKVNDTFYISGTGIKSFSCEIYNRWGTKIFEWDGMDGFWDGKTNNAYAPDGTYYYILHYSGPDKKEKSEKGYLTLLYSEH